MNRSRPPRPDQANGPQQVQDTKFFRGWLRGFSLGGLALSTAAIAVALAIAPARAMSLILVDADSGKGLRSENATYPWYPASTTKLMTLYMTLSAIRDQRITPDTLFTVSSNANSQGPTKMGFPVGTQVTVDNAIKTMMVKSANDMAVVLGAATSAARAQKAAELLESGFARSPLAWLLPAFGNVKSLVPIEAAPPELKDDMCGPHRKRHALEQAMEDSDPDAGDNSDNAAADTNPQPSGHRDRF